MRITLQIPFFIMCGKILALSLLSTMRSWRAWRQSAEWKGVKQAQGEFLELVMVIYNLSRYNFARMYKSALGESIENLHTEPT